jgi:MFS family permease
MFLAGRFLLGFGVSFCCVSAPCYVSEMAHPKWRGTITGLYNTCWYIGSIVASWTCKTSRCRLIKPMLMRTGYGTAFLTSNWSFRIPIWCQLVSSVIVAGGVFFIPESPRWLVAQDRVDEARAILGKYHGEGTPSIFSNIFNVDPQANFLNQDEMTIQLSTFRYRKCTTKFKQMLPTSAGGIIVVL